MKKSIVFVLLLCMAMVLTSSVALAGLAPALSKVNINALTAENYNNQWQFTPTGYPKNMTGYSFSGPELYMDVVYTGIPSWNYTFIKINGSQYKHSQLFDQQFFITDGGIIVGYEIVYKIPSTYLSGSNNITVTSSGTNDGSGSDLSTYIKFVK
jgi:hypothetical protein